MEIMLFIIQLIIIYIQNSPMRLDPSYLKFITKQELRILLAIEIGMKNHQYVPLELISSIGNLRSGETYKTIRKLLKVKLVVHVGRKNNGYKLTYLGYDYLALNTFMKRGVVKDVICKIGVGKQSDIYKCQAFDGTHIVLKLTRLGRRSFKTIKNNRQYIQNRTSFNWLYLSRLSSMRQFVFMQILHEDGFPTPKPIDTNRHAIVMSLIDGDSLFNVKKIGQNCSIKEIFKTCLEMVEKFASRGLIHGDFNQFNLLINGQGQLTVIDFPQCISSHHPNAEQYFNRDIECLYTFFDKLVIKSRRQDENGLAAINQKDKQFNVSDIPMPVLSEVKIEKRFDHEVKARGHFKLYEEKQLDQFLNQWNTNRKDLKPSQLEGIEQENESEEDQYQQSQNRLKQQEAEQIDNNQGKQEDILKELQKNNQKFHFDENDEDIKELMRELDQIQTILPVLQSQDATKKEEGQPGQEKEEEKSEQEEDQDGQDGIPMREQWKGLTAYQIRQILKQEKRKQRQKKKEEISTQQYIKRALYRKKSQRSGPISKGNYGAKAKKKAENQSIREGLQYV